ncbi:MAG: nucleotidyl transferase AbiEii/AbiGii toxin family protein [Deltaproteobacteria bacterium]|nr:nucleotidyl transferase AbiEii/AbiGii toxin family protein [Deltaproteobacteria bacterium]
MIPKDFITEWRKFTPWVSDAQVEQDLIVSRALIEIYKHPELSKTFAFRGGTALSKLYLKKSARYSEDIDLVQIKSEPIGLPLTALRAVLDPWLGTPQRNHKKGTVNLIYRFNSEGPPIVPLRLKIEMNCREHFSVFGFMKYPLSVQSRWYQGKVDVLTYSLEELLGTKLRALYQRRKGRDLFDLWAGLTMGKAMPDKINLAFQKYLNFQKVKISQKDFIENLDKKMNSLDFLKDIDGLILPSVKYDPKMAVQVVKDQLISRLE